jgi:YYY domain-containing protein
MADVRSRRFGLLLSLLFAGATLVRLFGLTWDQGHNYHPDERRISEAVQQLSFSPLQLDPKFYAYGSLPFYVTRGAASFLGNVSPWFHSWDGILLTSRVLSALWGAAGCVLLALLGRKLFGERAGLLAGALLAIAVFHVQNSHFGTNDIPLATLVTATFLLLIRALERDTFASFALAGAAAGLALATKASAATLFLPLGLAPLFLFFRTRRVARSVGAAASIGLGLAAAFLAGQPSVLFAAKLLLAGIVEQGQMVRNAGSVPYTNQYVGVPKVLYDLKEIVLWGLGPALGAAALLGVAARLLALARKREPRELLVWAWAVPFFAVTASFDVKFPRYLLPLYPVLLLGAAALLARRDSEGGGRRLARRAVLGLSGAYLLAFLAIYTRPHTIVAASEWFHANVAPGATVLTQHWDEGFPFSLPDRPAERFRSVELPFYDADSPAKTRLLAGQLASGDVLVLQTKRLYGAITRAKERYPDTDRLFRLLFAGDLGYSLVRTFSSPPGLFGLRLPSELADESFSVYDHPKAVVFRNAGRLPAPELERRLREMAPSKDLSRSDLLLARPDEKNADSDERIGGTRSTVLALVLWAALLQALGLAAWRLLGSRLPAAPGVYALSKIVGVVLFGAAAWGLVAWGPFTFVPSFVFAVAAGLILLGIFPGRPPRSAPRREVVATEAVVWGTFLFFAAVRAWSPEIFWGEKPMDFGILNALLRSELLPPPEPWFSGTTLSYTYFGHFLVAAFAKALAVHPALAFNLGVASTAALTAAGLFAAGALLVGRLRAGAWAVLLGLFAGNLSGLVELWHRRAVDFDLFWATSRVLKNQNEINEYPLWSFLFADLHAHVLAYPLLLGLLAVLLLMARQRTSPDLYVPPFGRSLLLGLAALFLGTLLITNGWSAPTAAGLLVVLLTVSALAATPRPARPLPALRIGRLLAGVVVPGAAIAVPALLFTLPFWQSFSPPPRNVGWEAGPYFGPLPFGLVHGLALVLVAPFLLFLLSRAPVGEDHPRRGTALLTGVLALLLVLSLVNLPALLHGHFSPAPSIRVFVFGLAALGFSLALGNRLSPGDRAAPALAAFAFLILGGCELVFVWDRMNTVFKFGLDATLLLAVAGAAAMEELLARARRSGLAGHAWRAAVSFVALAAFTTSALAFVGHVRTRRVETPRGTLDGLAYLQNHRPDEAAAVTWFEKNVPGLPPLAEAYGPAYAEYARFSSNTGLPTIVGWDYHVFQRGKPREAIDKRVADVAALYSSPGLAAGRVLSTYGTRFVVSGREERALTRGDDGLRRLPSALAPAFSRPELTIYRALLGSWRAPAPPPIGSAGAPAPFEPPPGPAQLAEPRGLACAPDGRIWVADFGHDRLVRFERGLRSPVIFGAHGAGKLEFNQPTAIAAGADGRVYVADTWNSRIQVLSPEGAYLFELTGGLYGPRGVATDARGRVFVSDTGNNRVVRFGPDGQVEKEWGRTGPGRERLDNPMGIAVDSRGTVWVSDNGNGRLCRFDPDGRLVSSFPVPGWRTGAYSEPHVVIDRDDNVWFSVPLEGEVRMLTPKGMTLMRLSLPRKAGDVVLVTGLGLVPGETRVLVVAVDGRLFWLSRDKQAEG